VGWVAGNGQALLAEQDLARLGMVVKRMLSGKH
jgi:hypothetical protein